MENADEILGATLGKVILDKKHFSFLVQVIDRDHLNAVGSYSEGRVLDSLEFLKKG